MGLTGQEYSVSITEPHGKKTTRPGSPDAAQRNPDIEHRFPDDCGPFGLHPDYRIGRDL